MARIVYINPQSMRNLAIYDYSLLTHVEGEVHYICSKFYDYKPLPDHVRRHNVFSYNNLRRNWQKALSYSLSYLWVIVFCLLHRPDVLHLQWLRIPAFDVRVLRLIRRITGCRIVFTAHNVQPHDTGRSEREAFAGLYRLADAIIVHTEVTKRELLDLMPLPEEKIHVVSHGLIDISIDADLLERQKDEYDRRYATDGCLVFSSLGYQYYYKGVDLLAEVWASTPELRDSRRCKLLVVGKNRGVDLSAFEGIGNVVVEDRIVPDEEFYYLLKHTDVYLLPYRKISQSGVLLTAIAERVPVLVTEVGGLTEPFGIAQIGWTLKELTHETLRDALLDLLNNPGKVSAVKNDEDGWRRVQQHYGWQRIGRLTQQVYAGKN